MSEKQNITESKSKRTSWQTGLVIGVLGIITTWIGLSHITNENDLEALYEDRAADIRETQTAMPKEEKAELLSYIPTNIQEAIHSCVIREKPDAMLLFGTCIYLDGSGIISIPYHFTNESATLDISTIRLQSSSFDEELHVSECRSFDELLGMPHQTHMALCLVDPDQIPIQMSPLDPKYYPKDKLRFDNSLPISYSFPALDLDSTLITYQDHPLSISLATPFSENNYLLTTGGGSSGGVIFDLKTNTLDRYIFQTTLGDNTNRHPTKTTTTSFPTYKEIREAINKMLSEAAAG